MSEIKERPILFSAPMVRAILEGRKTTTRRAVKGVGLVWLDNFKPEYVADPENNLCPYGKPGDRLWVRETWQADTQVDSIAPRDLSHGEPIRYPADWDFRQTGCAMMKPGKLRPSIHMPRWASRILLEITDVRVERLQDISEEQAKAEGIIPHVRGGWHWHPHDPANVDDWHQFGFKTPFWAFHDLWAGINGQENWDANPWVWAISFRRVTP